MIETANYNKDLLKNVSSTFVNIITGCLKVNPKERLTILDIINLLKKDVTNIGQKKTETKEAVVPQQKQ